MAKGTPPPGKESLPAENSSWVLILLVIFREKQNCKLPRTPNPKVMASKLKPGSIASEAARFSVELGSIVTVDQVRYWLPNCLINLFTTA
jgi:hypothetical protein